MIIRMLQLLRISIVDGWILEMLKTVVWRHLREPEGKPYPETARGNRREDLI